MTLAPELLEQLVAALAEELAPRLAAELAARLETPTPTNGLGMAGRVTLDELVSQLPPAKTPETWKRWCYEHLRRGEIPGAAKLGGCWFFDAEQVRVWLEAGAPCARPEVVP